MRKYYLGHLTDVVMVSAFMLAAERLGGADYDGDMIKTIADPILNTCVQRNYNIYRNEKYESRKNLGNIPLLMIPSAEPQIRNADDWRAQFETVRSTFSSRVGQICNAALDRSIIAYNENSDSEERQRCREETETLAILVGLEIDSAKSGVRPDLDEVDSNVERLPYLAQQLKKHMPRIKPKPAEDRGLFTFVQNLNWKGRLDKNTLDRVSTLLRDYETRLSRIRACRAPVREKSRKRDIDRILYAKGQEYRT